MKKTIIYLITLIVLSSFVLAVSSSIQNKAIHCYPLNESSGTNVSDWIGGAHGLAINTPTLGVAGQVGTAYRFNDGSVEWVNISTDIWSGTDNVSIAFWFQVNDTTDHAIPFAVGDMSYSGNSQEFTVIYNKDVTDYQVTLDRVGNENQLMSFNFNDNNWHYMVLTVDNRTPKMSAYLDGVLQVNITQTGTIADITNSAGLFTLLGTYWHNGGVDHSFDGILDEFQVYDDILTQAEILELYSNKTSCGELKSVAASPPTVSTNQSIKFDRGPLNTSRGVNGFTIFGDLNITGNVSALVNNVVYTNNTFTRNFSIVLTGLTGGTIYYWNVTAYAADNQTTTVTSGSNSITTLPAPITCIGSSFSSNFSDDELSFGSRTAWLNNESDIGSSWSMDRTGLLAYWKFSETTGHFLDSTGNGFNLTTVVGNVHRGVSSNLSLGINLNDTYVNISNEDSLFAGTKDIAVCSVFNSKTHAGESALGSDNVANGIWDYTDGDDQSNTKELQYCNSDDAPWDSYVYNVDVLGTNKNQFYEPYPIDFDVWHFDCGSYDYNESNSKVILSAYINGTLQGTMTDINGTANNITSPGRFGIGALYHNGIVTDMWNGTIDDIRAYNKTISLAEYQTFYTEQKESYLSYSNYKSVTYETNDNHQYFTPTITGNSGTVRVNVTVEGQNFTDVSSGTQYKLNSAPTDGNATFNYTVEFMTDTSYLSCDAGCVAISFSSSGTATNQSINLTGVVNKSITGTSAIVIGTTNITANASVSVNGLTFTNSTFTTAIQVALTGLSNGITYAGNITVYAQDNQSTTATTDIGFTTQANTNQSIELYNIYNGSVDSNSFTISGNTNVSVNISALVNGIKYTDPTITKNFSLSITGLGSDTTYYWNATLYAGDNQSISIFNGTFSVMTGSSSGGGSSGGTTYYYLPDEDDEETNTTTVELSTIDKIFDWFSDIFNSDDDSSSTDNSNTGSGNDITGYTILEDDSKISSTVLTIFGIMTIIIIIIIAGVWLFKK